MMEGSDYRNKLILWLEKWKLQINELVDRVLTLLLVQQPSPINRAMDSLHFLALFEQKPTFYVEIFLPSPSCHLPQRSSIVESTLTRKCARLFWCNFMKNLRAGNRWFKHRRRRAEMAAKTFQSFSVNAAHYFYFAQLAADLCSAVVALTGSDEYLD